jgi:hypothetical protein
VDARLPCKAHRQSDNARLSGVEQRVVTLGLCHEVPRPGKSAKAEQDAADGQERNSGFREQQ